MLPSDRRVEYFMIKRAIILHRSRPRLRLKGRGGSDNGPNPVPTTQGNRAPVRGGSGRGKAIWVNPHKTQTKNTISNSAEEKHRFPVKKNQVQAEISRVFVVWLSHVTLTAQDPAATSLTTFCPADSSALKMIILNGDSCNLNIF